MTLRDALATALANLSAHKMRSALAMLGVVFGVGAVIAMLSIGAGAEREALALIQRLGVDNILVRARDYDEDQLFEIRRSSVGLAQRDVEAIAAAVPGIAAVAPKVEIEAWSVRSELAATEASVFGVDQRVPVLQNLRLAAGRFLDTDDLRDHAQVCVIGPRVRRDLFAWTEALGGEIKVNEVWLTVVGVLEGSGEEADSFQGISLASPEDAIYLPLTTALRKFDRSALDSPLTELILQVRESEHPERASLEAAAGVRRLLAQLHGGVEDYELVVPQALLDQSRETQRLFNAVMGSIAGISLLVGGIGIMNIMLASVLERTREIGVRRAVGASKRDIRIQFVVESFSISILGGATGIVVGVVLALGIAAFAGWPTAISPVAVVVSALVSMTVGVASGVYPAVQASRLDPITSLRHE
jgi:putative ABC transport system permease protein